MLNSSSPHFVYLRIRVTLENQPAFFEFLRDAIPFYEKGGETKMHLLQDANNPESFLEIVEYLTEESKIKGEENVQSDPETLEYLSRWRALIDCPPVVEEYTNEISRIRYTDP